MKFFKIFLHGKTSDKCPSAEFQKKTKKRSRAAILSIYGGPEMADQKFIE